MREIPLADDGVVRWPRRALEEAYEETEPINLVRRLRHGQTAREDAPEQLTSLSISRTIAILRS